MIRGWLVLLHEVVGDIRGRQALAGGGQPDSIGVSWCRVSPPLVLASVSKIDGFLEGDEASCSALLGAIPRRDR